MELSEKGLDAIRLLMEQTIEEKVKPEISSLRNEMLEGFDTLHKQMETLQREYDFTGEHLKRKDTKLDDHEERLTTLEEKVAQATASPPKNNRPTASLRLTVFLGLVSAPAYGTFGSPSAAAPTRHI